MSETLYAKLLSGESFLLPEVNINSINVVIDSINDLGLPPLLAIVKEMTAISYQLLADYYFDIEVLNLSYDINPDIVADFIVGFRTPLVVISSCFNPNSPILDRNSEPKKDSQYVRTARRKSLDLVTRCTNANIAIVGTKVFTYCQEVSFIENEYYQIGVISSLTTFRNFTTRIEFDTKIE